MTSTWSHCCRLLSLFNLPVEVFFKKSISIFYVRRAEAKFQRRRWRLQVGTKVHRERSINMHQQWRTDLWRSMLDPPSSDGPHLVWRGSLRVEHTLNLAQRLTSEFSLKMFRRTQKLRSDQTLASQPGLHPSLLPPWKSARVLLQPKRKEHLYV